MIYLVNPFALDLENNRDVTHRDPRKQQATKQARFNFRRKGDVEQSYSLARIVDWGVSELVSISQIRNRENQSLRSVR